MKNKTQIRQVRQGDILIERISHIAIKNLKPIEGSILAHGEVTGHAHTIDDTESVQLFEPENDTLTGSIKFMHLTKDSALTHQEHARIPLLRGHYKVTRQREYSPEANRNVTD